MHLLACILFLSRICLTPAVHDRVYQSAHFTLYTTPLDRDKAKEIADSLENNYLRIINDLQSGELPKVNIHFYTRGEDLREAVRSVVPDLPIWAKGLAISVSEIHMLSPGLAGEGYRNMIPTIVHEFAHCVSYKVNPTIGNNPRWLWEAVAIYESGQKPGEQEMTGMIAGDQPVLSDLNRMSNPAIYGFGYSIAAYIVSVKGAIALNRLIKTNGNLRQILNMDEKQFTRQWWAYAKRK